MSDRRRRNLILIGLLILASTVLAACGFAVGGARPVATLVWPPNGAQLPFGQEVQVESLALDDAGIERVELWIDDVLVRTDREPTSGDRSSFGSVQAWSPALAGRHTLTIKAFNRRGVASAPSSVLVEVMPSSSASAGIVTPTATPTVLPTAAPQTEATAAACLNNATFVTDVSVPDDTRFKPGASFDKVWRMANSGTCAWGLGYAWTFESGDQLGAPASVIVPATAGAAELDIRVPMVAPQEPGRYSGRWRMQAPNGQMFGQRATVVIVVLPAGLEAPAAPADLKAEPLPPDAVRLSWTHQSDTENGVRIYAEDGTTLLATVEGPDEESATLEQLPCGATVGFTVRAYNDAGESPASEPARTQVPACQGVLPVIQYLKAEPGTISPGQTARLSWDLTGAREARLFPGAEGGVVAPGELDVQPTDTTTYRLVATNENGTVEMKVTVFVQ